MSIQIEHQILAAGFLSVSWKWYSTSTSNSSIIAPIILTVISIALIYFSYLFEQRWTFWNSEKLTFWIHQLKNTNRLPQASGFWCPLLSLFVAFLIDSDQNDYFAFLVLLIIYCPLALRFIFFNFIRKWKLSVLLADFVSITLSVFVLRSYFGFPLIWTFVFSPLSSVLNAFLIPKLMTKSAKSFTMGEFHLIYSSVLTALAASIKFVSIKTADGGDEFGSILLISSWSLISCVVFSSICFMAPIMRRTAILFWLTLFSVIVTAYLLCLFVNGLDMLSWTAHFLIFGSSMEIAYRRWIVFMFWLLCVACTIRFAVSCWTMPRLGTVHRKYFHLTIGLVVASGLLYDPELTVFASVLMFDGFVVLEIIRLCKVEPIGNSLRDVFAKFLDHQDQGPLILTPIYLLIGCFVPIWIDLPTDGVAGIGLRHFSGLIAVGVGDAAAAIGGTYFGRTPWRVVSNGRKTVQGTVCGFLAQLVITFCILHWIGSLGIFFTFGRIVWIIWSCFLISMLETFSAQVDNLILPLFAFMLLFGY